MYSHLPYELIVIDNSIDKHEVNRKHVHWFPTSKNIGHGHGLNLGVLKAQELFPQFPFLMFLDVDTHFLRHQWETPFIARMKHFDLIGGRGVPAKPIRPACMFMQRKLQHYDWRDTKDYKGHRVTPTGYDVAILAYHRIVADGHRVGFLEGQKNHYGTINGEEWCIDNVPLVYHHWSGTWLENRQNDFPNDDLLQDKKKLFDRIAWRLP